MMPPSADLIEHRSIAFYRIMMSLDAGSAFPSFGESPLNAR
jgi:hypothetical protein